MSLATKDKVLIATRLQELQNVTKSPILCLYIPQCKNWGFYSCKRKSFHPVYSFASSSESTLLAVPLIGWQQWLNPKIEIGKCHLKGNDWRGKMLRQQKVLTWKAQTVTNTFHCRLEGADWFSNLIFSSIRTVGSFSFAPWSAARSDSWTRVKGKSWTPLSVSQLHNPQSWGGKGLWQDHASQ